MFATGRDAARENAMRLGLIGSTGQWDMEDMQVNACGRFLGPLLLGRSRTARGPSTPPAKF